MHSFRVSGSPVLLVALVATQLRSLQPAADVTIVDDPAEAGVRIDVGAGRWIYVTDSRGVDERAVEALATGASAVLHLDSTADEFARALRGVVNGEHGLVPVEMLQWMAGQALANGETTTRNALRTGLTQREREILQLVARGHSNSEIAEALTISTNTVRTHLHALSVKLDATSRTKMLANARALSIPEALDHDRRAPRRSA